MTRRHLDEGSGTRLLGTMFTGGTLQVSHCSACSNETIAEVSPGRILEERDRDCNFDLIGPPRLFSHIAGFD